VTQRGGRSYDVFLSHGEVYVDAGRLHGLRGRDREEALARVEAAVSAGAIPFPLKRCFIAPRQVDDWFVRLQSTPLTLCTDKYIVHGYYAGEVPVGVALPRPGGVFTVSEQLSCFGDVDRAG
jgi:hypothetical protein